MQAGECGRDSTGWETVTSPVITSCIVARIKAGLHAVLMTVQC